MRVIDIISEATLIPSELFKPKYLGWRPQALLTKLQNPNAVFREKLANGTYASVIAAPGELQRLTTEVNNALQQLEANPHGVAPPSLFLNTTDGRTVPFSKIEKDELQTAKGKASSEVNVQPIGIGIAANPINAPGTKKKDRIVLTPDQEVQKALDDNKGIVAGQLGDIIANNAILDQAGDLGAAIKQAAVEISQGLNPDLSKYDEKTQKLIAIDAGEYLGILALSSGTAKWAGGKRSKFLNFLGTPDFSELTLIFPGEQNSSLSDSYGVQNSATGQTIFISSKGGKGSTASGAAPSLSGLTIPESLQKKKRTGNAVDFITLMQEVKVAEQPCAGLNFLNYYHKKALVGTVYEGLSNINSGHIFKQEDITAIMHSVKTGAELDPKFDVIIQSRKFTSLSTPGGKLLYCAAKDLVDIVNTTQPMRDFRTIVLELLGENFVQIFSRIVGKKLVFDVLWPGKVDGNVGLWTKIEASNPSGAGLSFKITD
jgi:hypothetical protein